MTASFVLQPDKEKIFKQGHPWIFPKAIQTIKGHPKTGELVSIRAQTGETLAWGAYNEHSLYRIRVLAYAWEGWTDLDYGSIIQRRLQQALQVRKSLGLPNAKNNAFRLFNSEAEGLSGLTIDYFDQLLVVSSSAFWVEQQKETILAHLHNLLPGCEVLWLSQAKPLLQDGWESAGAEPPSAYEKTIKEGGIQYAIQFAQTQKTGLFLDQRENHQRLAAWTAGKKVLDLYTYVGGFALHAAKAGASLVTAVDSSAAAIAQAQNNARLNGLEQIDFVQEDARNYLAKAGDYDVVILDPPKLVPGRAHLNKAKNYYRFLHRELFKVMRPGSLLMTCNCSSALNAQAFAVLVESQAREMNRTLRLLNTYGPAPCHPTLPSFPEGHYLTALLVSIS